MKILSTTQLREADKYTIQNEPITSINLMERAAQALFEAISERFSKEAFFQILCGKGNNGGDGLGLARLLSDAGYRVEVHIVEHRAKGSEDFEVNLNRLPEAVAVKPIEDAAKWTGPEPGSIIIDAMVGSGLGRPLEALLAEVVEKLNKWENFKIAVDIPTGLFADSNAENDLQKVLQCNWTLSLQLPKQSFYHRTTRSFVGEVTILDIGISQRYINNALTDCHLIGYEEILQIFKPRKRHSYKGDHGHAYLFAGRKGSIGAAIMSGKACQRAGAGLLTICAPAIALSSLQTTLPEAMVMADENEDKLTSLPDVKQAKAIGIGPGIGTAPETARVLKLLIQDAGSPMVIDADGLNILSENRTWIPFLAANTVLTPHIGEFRRLLNITTLGDDYLEDLKDFSRKNQVITVLKDSVTTVAGPSGKLYFFDVGSSALASAGSGDVLTGVILGLLASGYAPLQAALLGVYLHGEAGRIAGELYGLESTLAREVTDCLGDVFQSLYQTG